MVGEHSIGFLATVFAKLDAESNHNLSNCKTKRDRHRWCADEADVPYVMALSCNTLLSLLLHVASVLCPCRLLVKAYSLYSLLSAARRYWRKATKRGTKGEAGVI